MKPVKFFIILSLLIFSVLSCKDNSASPRITDDSEVTPGILSLTNNEPGFVWVSIKGKKSFDWIVAKCPDWIQPEFDTGTSDGASVKLYFTGNITPGKAQTLEGTIELIIVKYKKIKIQVVLTINETPKLSYTPHELSFSNSSSSNSLEITNLGGGLLNWKIKSENPRFKFSQESGQNKNLQVSKLKVSFDTTKLKPGVYSEIFTIYSEKDTGSVRSIINISKHDDFRAPAKLEILNSTIDTSFYLSNYGNDVVNWEINTIPNYITLSAQKGSINPGDSSKITIKILRSNLETGTFSFPLDIKSNSTSKSIKVSIDNFKEEKTFSDYDIVDAQLLSPSDLIVLATKNISALRILDFSGAVKNSIFLVYTPLCLSNICNNRIAVGHSGSITIVDLSTMTVEKNVPVSCDPVSLVLAPNNWVYASPAQDQWESIRCINLSTNNEFLSTGRSIYAGAKFILHTSGKYIYSISTKLSPQDIEKYDISVGKANRMYDSPYHGTYAMGWNFWMGSDGAKIFTSSGNVFKCAEKTGEDMIYGGNIGYFNIHSLYESASNGFIAVAYNTLSPNKTMLQIINSSNYSPIKSIKIPPYYFYDPTNTSQKYSVIESFSRYVFVSANGKKAFLILNPFTNGNLSNAPKTGWAFYSVDLDKK